MPKPTDLTTLQKLLSICGAPVERPTAQDWAPFERDHLLVPEDYKEFLSHFGSGYVKDAIIVFNLSRPEQVAEWERVLCNERGFRADTPSLYYPAWPLYPEPGGLLPFAYVHNCDFLYWRAIGTDPNRWTVAYGSPPDMTLYSETLVGFLVRLLTEREYGSAMPEFLFDEPNEFYPLDTEG